MNTVSDDDVILSDPEVEAATNLSRTTRWRLERRGEFPKRRQLSPNRVGWFRSEIMAWLAQRQAGGLEQPDALAEYQQSSATT